MYKLDLCITILKPIIKENNVHLYIVFLLDSFVNLYKYEDQLSKGQHTYPDL